MMISSGGEFLFVTEEYAPILKTSVDLSKFLLRDYQTTYFRGTRSFLMGFYRGSYLGLLPEIFDLPRRVELRVHVPPRSISVAARQTTIYTIDSPGGWHLIGQTPWIFMIQIEKIQCL